MPATGRLTRPVRRGLAATGLRKLSRKLIPPAVSGLTGLALRGLELGILPPPPRQLANLPFVPLCG
ncbi:MAG: hypothetical protein ACLPKI_29515 [Streptosporangiaceae bacterium]